MPPHGFILKDCIVVFHQTPFDGCLEEAALRLSKHLKPRIAVFSASPQCDDVAGCQGKLAKMLLLDWKNGSFQLMPAASRKFQPGLPSDIASRLEDTSQPTLTVLKWEGSSAYIPEELKRKWHNHIVYGKEWLTELEKSEAVLKLGQWQNFKLLGLPCFVFIFKSFGPGSCGREEKRRSSGGSR